MREQSRRGCLTVGSSVLPLSPLEVSVLRIIFDTVAGCVTSC
jgi:hypothetical protein